MKEYINIAEAEKILLATLKNTFDTEVFDVDEIEFLQKQECFSCKELQEKAKRDAAKLNALVYEHLHQDVFIGLNVKDDYEFHQKVFTSESEYFFRYSSHKRTHNFEKMVQRLDATEKSKKANEDRFFLTSWVLDYLSLNVYQFSFFEKLNNFLEENFAYC